MTITWITAGGVRTTTDRASLLPPALREGARVETNRWIKSLRLVRYGSVSMRERFRYRGESLWWFTELYLQKMRRLDAAVETILALDAAREAGARRVVVHQPDSASGAAALAFGRARGVQIDLEGMSSGGGDARWPGWLVGVSGRLTRLRPRAAQAHPRRPTVAAFVHTAFWRAEDPEGETYIGPILEALAADASSDALCFVGLGPRRNFRARRWWDPVTASDGRSRVIAIERLAPMRALAGSWTVWRQRRRLAAEVTDGAGIREAAIVRGCDLWPVLRRELEDAATVQWPWSARSMDEAGAAIDALEPGVVVTYAEAGGWGRALMLEARRRRVPSAAIQHGFIYRHWLNYQHEPDEMRPLDGDGGFPRPDRTLVYDRYAAEQLVAAGRFPADSVAVTGSARLENLAARLAALRAIRPELRRKYGAEPERPFAVLAAKFSEIRAELPPLVEAVSRVAGLQLAIKPHPAETADLYAPGVAAHRNIRVVSATADLAELLAAADLIITMNSTVAIDGLVLGVPALVVGLPNNLSPFVEAGVMLGAADRAGMCRALESVLYDHQVREGLSDRARAFVARYGLAPEPGAATRAAREILTLARPHSP